VVLLVAFAFWQGRAANPLLPPRVVLDRNRGGAYLSMLIAASGMFGTFLFLTYYLQQTLGYSPVVTGFAFLPMAGGIALAANLSTIVAMPRVGPKPLAALGMVIAPSINTGTFGVAPQDAGVASATVTVGQQLGASIGTSLLNPIFAGAVSGYVTAHAASARVLGRQALTGLALAHGYDTAFWWTAGLFAGGAVAGGILFRRGPLYQRDAASGSPAGDPPLSPSLNPQTPPTPAAAPGHRIDLI
jgi:hypothetical protein